MLQPGDNAAVTVTIFNSGGEANFTLNVEILTFGNSSKAAEFVEYFVDNLMITVGSNSTADFLVRLSVSENATDGLASTFTVIAQSTRDESNDFVTFQLTVSTHPPPEFTENVCKSNFVPVHDVYTRQSQLICQLLACFADKHSSCQPSPVELPNVVPHIHSM